MIIFGNSRRVCKAVMDRPYQFGLRHLFVWTAAVAVAIAAGTGRFGDLLQILCMVLATLLGACVVISIAMGGPWFVLIWCCQQVAERIRRATRRRRLRPSLQNACQLLVAKVTIGWMKK